MNDEPAGEASADRAKPPYRLAATWADVSIGTVVGDADGLVGETMSVRRQCRNRPTGYTLHVEVTGGDGAWRTKAVEATDSSRQTTAWTAERRSDVIGGPAQLAGPGRGDPRPMTKVRRR